MSNVNPSGVGAVSGLKFAQHFTLASQEGKRGRPRKNGRVFVRQANENVILDKDAIRGAVAAWFGKTVVEIQHYTHEECATCLSFRVPGLARDLGVSLVWNG